MRTYTVKTFGRDGAPAGNEIAGLSIDAANEVARAMAACYPIVTITDLAGTAIWSSRLPPGFRIINDRVMYSAEWLNGPTVGPEEG